VLTCCKVTRKHEGGLAKKPEKNADLGRRTSRFQMGGFKSTESEQRPSCEAKELLNEKNQVRLEPGYNSLEGKRRRKRKGPGSIGKKGE